MSQTRTTTTLSFAAALSTNSQTSAAVAELADRVSEQLAAPAHLVMAFVSSHHRAEMATLAERICDTLGCDCLLGCTAESVVGGRQEIEGEPAIALWAAHLPGARVTPLRLELANTAEGATFVGWPDELAEAWPEHAFLLMLGEPFSFPADALLERINQDHPGVPVFGGMASGGSAPGENRLLLGRRELAEGAVAVLISGPVRARAVVSQGCRPIGRPFVITKGQQNVIEELSGAPALARFREVYQELGPAEQQLLRGGLHVGVVTNEYQGDFGRGDFLVRNVVGADPERGAIAIGDFVRVGQTVQFHVRDANTADEDLNELLAEVQRQAPRRPAGALLFTCNGRGTRLFSEPHHDAAAIQQPWGEMPLAGFFAQGEIGPIGGTNFLHGFTASIVLFEPASD